MTRTLDTIALQKERLFGKHPGLRDLNIVEVRHSSFTHQEVSRMLASAGKVAIIKAFNRDTIQGDIGRGKSVGLRLFGTNGDCHRNASLEEIRSALIYHSVHEELISLAMGPTHHHMTEKERASVQSALRLSGYLLDENVMITNGVGSLSVWVDFLQEVRRKIGRENHGIALEPTYANQFMILSVWK